MIRVQLEIVGKISTIGRPDWGQIESLLNRWLWKIGDRAPAVTAPVCLWIEQNATRYRTVTGNWRIEKSELDRGRSRRFPKSP